MSINLNEKYELRKAAFMRFLEGIAGPLAVLVNDLAPGEALEPVFTADAKSVRQTGHSVRALIDAFRRGDLVAVKVSRGIRIERADLTSWEAIRSRKTRRAVPGHIVANDVAASVETDAALLARVGVRGRRR